MKSILSLAAVVLLGITNAAARSEYPAAALVYRQWKPLVYEGCYNSHGSLSQNSTYLFNTMGYCQQQCAPLGKAVEATSNGNECWCGDEVPPSSAKVDDSKCDTVCAGYGPEFCGADGFFSVYLSGLTDDVPNAAASSGSSPSSTPKTSATTTAPTSFVTIGGETVVVTAPAQSTSSVGQKSSSGGGSNKAAIAAGVVVGIVVIAAIAGGAFLYLRHQRRRQVEEEYRRKEAVSSFVNGGKSPTSSGGGSSFTDTRLDPTVIAQRRMSDGSIADNQDYSRRILKVTNA